MRKRRFWQVAPCHFKTPLRRAPLKEGNQDDKDSHSNKYLSARAERQL
jgi:hypothetical protein